MLRSITASLALSLALTANCFASPFLPGNLVVYRVNGTTNAATAVFVDEYTTTGTLVQSIALPTTSTGSQKALTASATATAEGYLNLSTDGQYVLLTGYGADAGTASVATSLNTGATPVNRVVGRITAAGVVDTSTALGGGAYSAASFRSATSTNGTDIWVSGVTGGIQYTTFGSTTGVQLNAANTTDRVVEIYGGQLSAGLANGIANVGTGLPMTAGQTLTIPAGLTPVSPYGFFFADLDAGVAGIDTAYVADDGVGIIKYSLVAGTWTSNGFVGANADDYRGLTGTVTANGVQLYSTKQASTNPGIYSLLDANGYNLAISGTPTQIAALPTGNAFRGIDFAPAAAVPEASAFLFAGMIGGVVGLGRLIRKVSLRG